jgi:hypothetical protein
VKKTAGQVGATGQKGIGAGMPEQSFDPPTEY